MTHKNELLQEFGTALVNLLFDGIEDAVEDAQGDLDLIADENAPSEETQEEQSDEAEMASELAAIVLTKLAFRLNNAKDWKALRQAYPRSLDL